MSTKYILGAEHYPIFQIPQVLQHFGEGYFDFAIVNTWAGARLAYLTGLDYFIYFVGSALRVPPFIKNPKLDYLTKPLPSHNIF